ncbi:hypothetical protein [Planktothrix sp.]|uniref:hypothetical protein n=1 Tax=Planktothrix sp. TaxID=3088171 RepID=UPI0038D41515
MTIYSPQELADITGLSVTHLVRPNEGPIARILQTFHWQSGEISPDGKSLTEFGLDLLEDYCRSVGKKGQGMTYEDWQQKMLNQYQPSTLATVENLPLIPVENYSLPPFLPNISPFNFAAELEGWAGQQAEITRAKTLDTFRRAVTIPTIEGIEQGREELKEILKKLGV